jgi:hypothetical protein
VRFRQGPDRQTPGVTSMGMRRMLVIATATVALTLLAGGWWYIYPADRPSSPAVPR